MEHYVQYHNAEFMGGSCNEFGNEAFGIVTNKPVSRLQGSKIWLVCGEEKPRKYFLCQYFIVDEVGEAEGDPDFRHYARGKVGVSLRPPILLNPIPWFADFRKSQGNFGFGLTKIEGEYAEKFEKLVSDEEVQAFEQALRVGAGFGDPETNRKVERAAIACVAKYYESHGWTVQSVEADRCGFDLLCVKGALEEHVEVKGIQGEVVSFIITSGEVRQAQDDEHFVLCVVTSAISNQPQLSHYEAKDFAQRFNLSPIAFRASLRV